MKPDDAPLMVCPNCNTITATDTGFCRKCRAPLNSNMPYYIDYGLAPPKDYRWDLHIGYSEYHGDKNRVGFNSEDLQKHLAIMGNLGSGKTTLVKRILVEFAKRGGNFLLIDPEGEYRDLGYMTGAKILAGPRSATPLKINLFERGRAPIYEYAEHVYGTFYNLIGDSGIEFSPQMQAILRESCIRAVERSASLDEFKNIIYRVASGYNQPKASAIALVSRLSVLFSKPTSQVFSSGEDTLGNVLNNRTIIDISWAASSSAISASFIAKVIVVKYSYSFINQPITNSTRFLLVVDEADRVLFESSNFRLHRVFSHLMMQARKRGIGVVLVIHNPSSLDQRILKNVGNVAVFRLDHPDDTKMASGLLGMRPLDSIIKELDVGIAIVKPASAKNPFLVKIDRIEGVEDGRGLEMKVLESIYKKPYLTQRERRAYLGLDGRTYRKIIMKLKKDNLIEEVTVRTGHGRPVKLLQVKGMNPSIAHRYLAHHAMLVVKRLLKAEARIRSRGPDIVVATNGTLLCIEVETGSNVNAGKYARFLEYCDTLIILCDAKVCKQIASRTVSRLPKRDRVYVTTLYRLSSILKRVPLKAT